MYYIMHLLSSIFQQLANNKMVHYPNYLVSCNFDYLLVMPPLNLTINLLPPLNFTVARKKKKNLSFWCVFFLSFLSLQFWMSSSASYTVGWGADMCDPHDVWRSRIGNKIWPWHFPSGPVPFFPNMCSTISGFFSLALLWNALYWWLDLHGLIKFLWISSRLSELWLFTMEKAKITVLMCNELSWSELDCLVDKCLNIANKFYIFDHWFDPTNTYISGQFLWENRKLWKACSFLKQAHCELVWR